jgi:hypothetical protein
MTKSLVAVLLSAFAAVSFAQGASAPADTASTAKKSTHHKHHAKKSTAPAAASAAQTK